MRLPGLWNDAVEYLAIGNAWVHGSGFVDPVRWTNYLPVGPPFPALLLRAPLPAAVLALPLWLGGGVVAVRVFHAVLASLVVGGLVLFGRRMMGLAASIACALAIGFMPSWVLLAGMPMSDLPAVGVMLVVLALGVRVGDSVPWAAACALATILGWATRPTLVALAPAIVLALVWQRGVVDARRSRPLIAYVVLTATGFLAARLAVIATTGHAPYAGYGFMSEMLSLPDVLSYRKEYVGSVRFVATHGWVVARALLRNVGQLADALFVTAPYARLGWLAVPGTIYCLVVRAPAPDRTGLRRLVATCGLISAVLALASYGAFDVYRYPMPFVVCGTLCGFAALDDAIAALVQRSARLAPRLPAYADLLRAAPVAIVLLSSVQPAKLLERVRWRPRVQAEPSGHAAFRDVCRSIAPGTLVAATNPWSIHAWCGNPALRLPIDLAKRPALQERFLREQRPAYVVSASDGPEVRWMPASPLLRRIARSGVVEVYEVIAPVAPSADRFAVPPLMCAGYGEACRRELGR
ncbi:hypothetical protein K2Z84_27500 [Candidatus Binatia bacterium]|nr:hypothetical protein [Candidatus Binatia bacterium]